MRATLTAHRNKSGVADYAVKMQLIQCLPGTSFHTRSVVREVCLFLLLPMTGSSVHSIVATWECVLCIHNQSLQKHACISFTSSLYLPATCLVQLLAALTVTVSHLRYSLSLWSL